MCSGGDVSPEEKARTAQSREIDKQLRIEETVASKGEIVKLLLLGAGESGKSTVLKQMKLMNGAGFTPAEIANYRAAIISNIITCVETLIDAMDTLRIPYGFKPDAEYDFSTANANLCPMPLVPFDKSTDSILMSQRLSRVVRSVNTSKGDDLETSKKSVKEEGVVTKADDPISRAAECIYEGLGGSEHQPYPPEITILKASERMLFGLDLNPSIPEAIKYFWSDPGVQYCYSRSNEYQLMDCCAYFLSDAGKFLNSMFKPTEMDILKARIMTTTVTESNFKVNAKTTLRVYDVGGQRSERKKWAPYFQDVKAIIFLIAISSYDQVCMEDESMNRMVENMNLFASICNHPMFKSTSMIVFMNKIDIFNEKLAKSPISKYFPSFTANESFASHCLSAKITGIPGENSYEEGSAYFSERISELNKYPEKSIYIYFTWATDTTQISSVLGTVNSILLGDALMNLGML
ncbi:guanine nucleotide binding protein, alpha subunit [Chytriomyces cf. hyalinus JEL632]|nr:guanine nucleotide binding protein, alpha subunit [Chytriomyces cf. hyalinus JEL632]